MIKIVYIISSIKTVGPIFMLKNIIKYIPKDKFRIYLITISANQDDSLCLEFRNMGVEIYSLNYSRIRSFLFARSTIENKLQIIKPDIIHSHGLRADFINSKIRYSAKKVTTLRCFPYEDFINKYGRIVGTLTIHFFLKNMQRIDNRVACSNSISKRMEGKKSLIFTPIPNGLDLSKFNKTTNEHRLELRKNLKLPEDKKIFISVGDMDEGKNQKLIFDAFKTDDDNKLIIFLGSGPQLTQLRKLSQNSTNIKFMGKVNNVKDFLQASDYFISASLSEGMPNAVLEAMGTGLPVILSDIPSHREIFEKNRFCGILFKNKDLESIKTAISSITVKDYSTMSDSSYKIVDSYFSASKMATGYKNFYESLF